MNIASRGATMAVDWEQRIDFGRLRSERLEKARVSLRDSELGAVLLMVLVAACAAIPALRALNRMQVADVLQSE